MALYSYGATTSTPKLTPKVQKMRVFGKIAKTMRNRVRCGRASPAICGSLVWTISYAMNSALQVQGSQAKTTKIEFVVENNNW